MRAQEDLRTQLRDAVEVERAVRQALKFAAGLLRADGWCVAVLEPGEPQAAVMLGGIHPPTGGWPTDELARFIRGERVELASSLAVGRLRRRRRAWGALVLHWDGGAVGWGLRTSLTKLAAVCNEALERIEARRLSHVRGRLDRKIMEQLRPKDLLYHILDGLRSLTGYDHSASILLKDAEGIAMELAAEQLAFEKRKSPRIGAPVVVPEGIAQVLERGRVWGFRRNADEWRAWTETEGEDASKLPAWMDAALPPLGDEAPPAREVIIAPLHSGTTLTGVVRLAAARPETFGPYEGELLETFVPHAVIALQNARRAESLEEKMIESERKHAMAELARGVSHDVNNALGAVLPLVQEMREEAEAGSLDAASLRHDLVRIEHAVNTCIRVFGGMLQFARRAAADGGSKGAGVNTAVEAALAIYGDGLTRHGIRVVRDIPDGLAPAPVRQSELEQVVMNLVANARDGMLAAGHGGELRFAAGMDDRGGLWIEVTDDGVGIPAENLARVQEPFFTTKPQGNGLGLSICRSIAWQGGGKLIVKSPVAAGAQRPGTRVRLEFPGAGSRA